MARHATGHAEHSLPHIRASTLVRSPSETDATLYRHHPRWLPAANTISMIQLDASGGSHRSPSGTRTGSRGGSHRITGDDRRLRVIAGTQFASSDADSNREASCPHDECADHGDPYRSARERFLVLVRAIE